MGSIPTPEKPFFFQKNVYRNGARFRLYRGRISIRDVCTGWYHTDTTKRRRLSDPMAAMDSRVAIALDANQRFISDIF